MAECNRVGQVSKKGVVKCLSCLGDQRNFEGSILLIGNNEECLHLESYEKTCCNSIGDEQHSFWQTLKDRVEARKQTIKSWSSRGEKLQMHGQLFQSWPETSERKLYLSCVENSDHQITLMQSFKKIMFKITPEFFTYSE